MLTLSVKVLVLSSTIYNVASQVVCPVIERSYSNTRLQSSDSNGPDFREISGLAFSPTQRAPSGESIFFAASDGGGGERIGIFDSATGRRLKTIRIDRDVFRNTDWESMTIGSCGSSGIDDTCLYVMDAGDNKARQSNGSSGRSKYEILKIKEPRWEDVSDNEMIPKNNSSVLSFDYRHSSSPSRYADCESMFLDHKGWGYGESIGDIYLVPKWDRGNNKSKNRLFKIPSDAWASTMDGSERHHSPTTVGKYDYGDYQDLRGSHLMQTTWTSAEMSFDGTLISIGTSQKSYVFLRCPGTSVPDAIANPDKDSKACVSWRHPATGQVESFAFTPDKLYSLDIPEGTNPRMGWTKFDYDTDTTSRRCPSVTYTDDPTRKPTTNPTRSPTRNPTDSPSTNPSKVPTTSPTRRPTPRPSPEPTRIPTDTPSTNPSRAPTPGTRKPTTSPTRHPTPRPSPEPTRNPTDTPSMNPSAPTFRPTSNPSPPPPPCNGHLFKLRLQTDDIGSETSWYLQTESRKVIARGSMYPKNALIEIEKCLNDKVHTFMIFDSRGEGLCCSNGNGWYQILYDGILLVDSDGKFGSQEVVSFSPGKFKNETTNPTPLQLTPAPAFLPSTEPTRSDDNSATSRPTALFASISNDFPIFCPGVCTNGETLVDGFRIAVFPDGTGDLCRSLEIRYRQLYLTNEACNALSASAQNAGCDCTDAVASIASESFEEAIRAESPSIAESVLPEPKVLSPWAIVGLFTVVIFGVGVLLVRSNLVRSSRDDASVSSTSKTTVACTVAVGCDESYHSKNSADVGKVGHGNNISRTVKNSMEFWRTFIALTDCGRDGNTSIDEIEKYDKEQCSGNLES